MTRSLDGTTRLDMGAISIITHPGALKLVVLDHVKMEARTLPMPVAAMPPVPGVPGMPGAPAIAAPQPPGMPPMQVQELGVSIVQGVQAVGKRFTIQPPAVPKQPAVPGALGMPTTPEGPMVSEIWTCAQTHLPVMTKLSGSFGTQTSICRVAPIAEPNPATFQIPPGYKQLN